MEFEPTKEAVKPDITSEAEQLIFKDAKEQIMKLFYEDDFHGCVKLIKSLNQNID